jgi:hypothetical protein
MICVVAFLEVALIIRDSLMDRRRGGQAADWAILLFAMQLKCFSGLLYSWAPCRNGEKAIPVRLFIVSKSYSVECNANIPTMRQFYSILNA